MAGLVVYQFVVGLDRADKVGGSVGGVVALVALGAPYLLPRPQGENLMPNGAQAREVVVEGSGDAKATAGGVANTGVETVERDAAAVRVTGSGKAVAEGSGSVANTGVRHVPRS
ncbi:hypothetical protein PV646_31000 [Streptomyces sp. ID05-26A]|nr:hypothetical protein [Streptomyces sp. ID05-26A]